MSIAMLNRITLNFRGIVLPPALAVFWNSRLKFHLWLVTIYILFCSCSNFFIDLTATFMANGTNTLTRTQILTVGLQIAGIVFLAICSVLIGKCGIHFTGLAALIDFAMGVLRCEGILNATPLYAPAAAK
ncbi:MAG: hypothetical protein P4M11_07635 [Candidatus Pacebacteria bacterium]|nr:hypothetical protein [Candidatus Paceibacterota bacterium]